MTTIQQRSPTEYFPMMLKLARDMGCQMRPTPTDYAVLRGICPFHDANTLRDAKTLNIDTKTTRFWCNFCPAKGYPVNFAAMIWGVSLQDARKLINHHPELDTERPPYPPEFFQPQQRHNYQDFFQNTAALTRASRHHAQNLLSSYPALHLLARLSVSPEQAAAAGIGFSTGIGLTEYLKDHGVTDQEINTSPLFDKNTGAETLAGRITIAETDQSGATVWITSMLPPEPNQDPAWTNHRETIYGLPGAKPYIFNMLNRESDNADITLTDDPRLYIVLRANDVPCLMFTKRQRQGEDVQRTAARIATHLTDRHRTRHVVLAMYDHKRALSIQHALEQTTPGLTVVHLNRQQIASAIDPQRRNLTVFARPPAATDANSRTPNTQKGRDSSKPSSRNGPGPQSQDSPGPTLVETAPEADAPASPTQTHLETDQPEDRPGDSVPEQPAPHTQQTHPQNGLGTENDPATDQLDRSQPQPDANEETQADAKSEPRYSPDTEDHQIAKLGFRESPGT